MKNNRFMIIVAGFTYKTRLTAKRAVKIEQQLKYSVNDIRIVPMPELIG